MAKVEDLIQYATRLRSFSTTTIEALIEFTKSHPEFQFFYLIMAGSGSETDKVKGEIKALLGENHNKVRFTTRDCISRVMLCKNEDDDVMVHLTLMGLISRYDDMDQWIEQGRQRDDTYR